MSYRRTLQTLGVITVVFTVGAVAATLHILTGTVLLLGALVVPIAYGIVYAPSVVSGATHRIPGTPPKGRETADERSYGTDR